MIMIFLHVACNYIPISTVSHSLHATLGDKIVIVCFFLLRSKSIDCYQCDVMIFFYVDVVIAY